MHQLTHHEVSTTGRQHPIRVLCPGWRDPRNVGSVFRLADAAGLAGLFLAGTTPQPPNPKIKKTARSTIRHVPYRYVEDAVALLEKRRAAGAYILSLEITNESTSLLTYALPDTIRDGAQEMILIDGAEDVGIAPELLALSHASVHLPMHGQNTSMNVAVALGAAVYLLLAKM
ncbi:MAG: TrmH family RNA methyltransferase [Bacteroidota bacterium]